MRVELEMECIIGEVRTITRLVVEDPPPSVVYTIVDRFVIEAFGE